MNNKMKPVWMFSGFFLVTLLWALEFDNRPRSRLVNNYNPGLMKPQVFDEVAKSVRPEYQKKKKQVAEVVSSKAQSATETVARSGSVSNETPHRNGLLSDSTKRLISIANRQLPAHEQIPYQQEDEASSPSSHFNSSMYGADNLYACFTDRCLNAMNDY